MNYIFTKYIAQYNCDAYGANAYNNAACGNTTTGGAAGSSGGSLAKTGLDVVVPLTAGILLILVAIALFIRNIRRQRANS